MTTVQLKDTPSETIALADVLSAHAALAGGTPMVAVAAARWDTLSQSDLQPIDGSSDIDPSSRLCILFEDIFECDGDTAILAYSDDLGALTYIPLSGPEHDHAVAVRAISFRIEAGPLPTALESPALKRANMAERAMKSKAVPIPLKPVAANDNHRFSAVDAETLLGMKFAPVKWVIPGFVTEGLTILGGRPKLGKSWLSLGFGVGVATGGNCLGSPCVRGDALYLALEDNQRRLQDRLRTVLPKMGRPEMSRLSLQTEAPKVGAGLVEMLDAWRKSVADPRLIIIDTLAIVRPPKKGNQDSYAADYEALSPLQRFASEHRLAVVVVTHVRKMEAADPLEMISGTNGLTGAADSIMVLDRGTDGCKLYGRGRDIEEIEKALKFDAGVWTALGNVDDVKRSDERKQIMDALASAVEPMKPADIATATGLKPTNVRYLLGKMVSAGECEKTGYGLYLPPSQSSHPSQLESSEINSTLQYNSLANCEDCEDCEGALQSGDLSGLMDGVS